VNEEEVERIPVHSFQLPQPTQSPATGTPRARPAAVDGVTTPTGSQFGLGGQAFLVGLRAHDRGARGPAWITRHTQITGRGRGAGAGCAGVKNVAVAAGKRERYVCPAHGGVGAGAVPIRKHPEDFSIPNDTQPHYFVITLMFTTRICVSAEILGSFFECEFREDSACHICNVAFGLFTRRHHCRHCGHSLCSLHTKSYKNVNVSVVI
jgi:hypothetical protein